MADVVLKPGDTIRLKSGGPLMTLANIGLNEDGKPYVTCLWFDGAKESRGFFPLIAVQADTDKPGFA